MPFLNHINIFWFGNCFNPIMQSYVPYLKLLLKEMPEYSAMGIIHLIGIHIKYKSLLCRMARNNMEWEESTTVLLNRDSNFESAIDKMEKTLKENERRMIFQTTAKQLKENISILIGLLTNQRVLESGN